MCTPYRWRGNGAGRFKDKDEREMRDMARLEEADLDIAAGRTQTFDSMDELIANLDGG